jgi:hypothetical protein
MTANQTPTSLLSKFLYKVFIHRYKKLIFYIFLPIELCSNKILKNEMEFFL